MELHPQAQAVLDTMAALGFPPITEVSPPEARQIRRAHVRPSAIEFHEIRDVDAGGVPARLYRPNDDEGLGLLVYFHGGGWVFGDLDTHDATCSRAGGGERTRRAVGRLPARAGAPVPGAFDDAPAATRWARENAA